MLMLLGEQLSKMGSVVDDTQKDTPCANEYIHIYTCSICICQHIYLFMHICAFSLSAVTKNHNDKTCRTCGFY